MNKRGLYRVILVAFLFVGGMINPVYADVKHQLVSQLWKKERASTFEGRLTTLWMFFEDGTGVAYQRFNKHGKIKALNHAFTYTVDKNRVTIQEEIDKEWEGFFGVTHWTLHQNKLIGDIKLGSQQLVFTPFML